MILNYAKENSSSSYPHERHKHVYFEVFDVLLSHHRLFGCVLTYKPDARLFSELFLSCVEFSEFSSNPQQILGLQLYTGVQTYHSRPQNIVHIYLQ